MKTLATFTAAIAISGAVPAQAEQTFELPKFSHCSVAASASNTNDREVYRIFSDFYYEIEDSREYAVKAVQNWAENFAEDCAGETTQVSLDMIQCDNFIGGAPVCRIESDEGDYVIVKDYVDSTNVVLSQHDQQTWPDIFSSNDQETLWMARPELCYSELLEWGGDSQAYYLDTYNYRYFGDYRYVLARSSRDLVQNLEVQFSQCEYDTVGVEANKMQCSETTQGTKVCASAHTNGGYFVFVSDDNHGMHVIFNRWD
ncbi:hypothetical protein BTJ40_09170 [Microbulbifer sp. A4B17]|uniref:hypothetical protein n=1 Tax=Microbulbifer sp. A4B17 TaxID=359370 RepID=UPI000D52DE8C|nr:hypothetical protein [Microbulbifer sp. A4B17]AWF80967.1 hypothetical protein BTJ40_09170 [Microbulbifer sp. A4B17]